MKKLFSTILVAIVATVASYAQTIAVVSSSGSTTMYQTLADAIDKAASGSVIYLPGGGFQLSDDIKINKKLTIMGVSHRADTDNAEGATVVSGNINLDKEASGSAFMGFYLSGDLIVGGNTDDAVGVDNITVRKCNLRSVQVKNPKSTGMVINECYIREAARLGSTNAKITNCVAHSFGEVVGGVLDHNVVFYYIQEIPTNYARVYHSTPFFNVHNSIITNNILLSGVDQQLYGNNCVISNNWFKGYKEEQTFGECSIVNCGEWKDFINDITPGISISSNLTLITETGKGSAASDGTQIGIYGGTGFDDHALAPIPRIVSKTISEQTDAEGKLNIKITVKSGSNSAKGTSGNDSSGSGTSGSGTSGNGTSGNGAGGGGTNMY